MRYKEKIEKQGRPSKRPTQAEQLLLDPISADDDATESYPDWEFDHGTQKRFYVGGFLWFLRQCRISPSALASYKKAASELVKHETEWDHMPNSGTSWDELARQQFNLARQGRPLLFQKAALVIAACELAARERLQKGEPTGEIEKPEDIYKTMAIIPAVYNIGNFDSRILEEFEHRPEAKDALRENFPNYPKLIEELSSGHTVTLETAKRLKAALEKDAGLRHELGVVRPTPGAHKLGRKSATPSEHVDHG